MFSHLWVLAGSLVFGSSGLAVLGLYLVRHFVPARLLREHHDVAGFILAIVGVIYAVLLAFVVLVVWERYGNAEVIAEREANSLVDLYAMAPGLSPKDCATVRADTEIYAQSVAENEFASMRDGKADGGTSSALDHLWATCMRTEARDTRDELVTGKIVDRLTEVSDNRRLRLLASRTGVPTPMWVVLWLGFVATVLFTFYFGLDNFRVQSGMTVLLTTLIALVLFLISALNYPFSGDLRVQPDAMNLALKRFPMISANGSGRLLTAPDDE